MTISKWTAYLSNGATIDQSAKENDVIQWAIPHWESEENQVEKVEIQVVEENGFSTGKVLLKLKDIAFMEMMAFRENDAVELLIKPEQKPDAVLSYYMFNDWWTRPAFGDDFKSVPERTNVVLTKTGDSYTGYLALPGNVFKARFHESPEADQLAIVLSAYHSGYAKVDEDIFLAYTDSDPYRCLEKLMKEAASRAGILDRANREYPEMFEKIGWCSWDAFYKDITEEKVLEKVEEIKEKQIPFGWILLDDGWLHINNERLVKMSADPEKFPNNLISTVEKIKADTDAKYVGVWHAFASYWGGVDFASELYEQQKENLIETAHGKFLPAPQREKAYRFFADWYQYLAKQGIDFVKVDSQSTVLTHYKGNAPIGRTARELHWGLDHAVADQMNGLLINCMGMGVENVLARPFSGVSRNSDDFFPLKEKGFEEHLLQNVYNSLYHTILYHGDWDMFWSSHPDAEKHAVIRALSGGPIYVSDKTGESVKEVIMRLCYQDGTILRADNPAVPTADCIFQDPAKKGYLKIKNECNGVSYLAVFNYADDKVEVPYQISDVVENADPEQKYAVYGYTNETFEIVTASELKKCILEKKGYELFQIAPVVNGLAVFGLKDKYLSSHAIEDISYENDILKLQVKEAGEILVYCAKKPEKVFINNEESSVTLLGE